MSKYHSVADVWAEGLTPETVAVFLDTLLSLKNGKSALLPSQLGTASRSFINGHLKAVLPLDSAKELQASKTMEPAAVKARDAGIAARLLKAKGTCQVIVLGGSHDLTPYLAAGVQYLRVAVLSYREFAGE